jgi:hypothetical protein
MLFNIGRYKSKISEVLQQKRTNPTAELEWRLGIIDDGRFTSRVAGVDGLRAHYKFTHSSYTVMLYENGVRVRDGKAEQKKRVATLDLDYRPVAARLALSTEEPGVMPQPDEIPTGTREIERWTCSVGKGDKSPQLMLSHVDGRWEVEIEFREEPRDAADATAPLEEVLKILLPDRPNMLSADDIREVARGYNEMWHDMAPAGFLRRVGYKPLNFVESDCKLLLEGAYAVSNKLDGTKYVLMCADDNKVYIVNDTDAMYLGESAAATKFTTMYFDGEWDPHDSTFQIFDFQTRDDIGLEAREKISAGAVRQLALKHVMCKGMEIPKKNGHADPKWAGQATVRVIAAMRKRYGADWAERNDGIIYTPAFESYLAGRERPRRTLKWKFPDKISIDLRLQLVSDDDTQIYETLAQDRQGETKLRDVHVEVARDDPLRDDAHDGVIAEVGLDQGRFYIMRLRPDKTAANFITVVTETLKDMRKPFTLAQLLAALGAPKLKTIGGAFSLGGSSESKELIHAPGEELLAEARKYVEGDRREFEKVYRAVLEFATTNKLRLSNPECLLEAKIPSAINLYARDGLRTANDLANKLYEHTPIIFMKTNIPYMEFEISALNRLTARVYSYPRVRHVRTEQLFRSIPLRLDVGGKENGVISVETLHEEIELIEIYHRLYMPFPERWDAARSLEVALWQQKKSGGARSGPAPDREKTEFAKRVREALYESLEFNDLGVLVGPWGYHELARASKAANLPSYDKVQLLSRLAPDALKERVENILRDVTPVRLEYKTEEVFIPHDMHLRRTIYYFDWKGKRTALFDSFNSLDYELVPVVMGRGKKLRVGNPYVLQRFFLIDLWMLGVLAAGGYLTPEIARQKSTVLMDRVRSLRAEEYIAMCGGDEYEGTYKDLAIERRRVLKQEEKFRPYKPLEYFEHFGKLRQMGGTGGDGHSDSHDPE